MVEAKAIFASIDTAGSGSLSLPEMHRKLSDFGLEEQTIERLFYGEPSRCSFGAHRSGLTALLGAAAALDADRSGAISEREFIAGFSQYMRALRGEEPADARPAFPLKATLHAKTVEPVPAEQATRSHHGGSVRVHKATYAANAPSEDRSTLALGEDFIFAGVWDGAHPFPAAPQAPTRRTALIRVASRAGHGGTPCSEFVEGAAFGKAARPAFPRPCGGAGC